eukprot:Hpha_TRINITY_DN15900_c0_g1::TRINITY_DN15900_c0_g1_i1::g.73691::m.73691
MRRLLLRVEGPLRVQRRFATILDSYWERLEGAGAQPHGGYHWFGKYMFKATKLIEKKLQGVDVVVEVRDARAPFSSYNPDLEALTCKKPRLLVFNKVDLADQASTARVRKYYEGLGVPTIMTHSTGVTCEDVLTIVPQIRKLAPPSYLKDAPTFALFVGLPNVGKSSLVKGIRTAFLDELTNPDAHHRKTVRKKLLKRRRMIGGGVDTFPNATRKMGYVYLPAADGHKKICLVDTPGIMVPSCIDPIQAVKLGLIGLTDWARNVSQDIATRMGYYCFQVAWNNGMETNIMTHFRLHYPPPNTFEEFWMRIALSKDLLTISQKKHLPNESDSASMLRRSGADKRVSHSLLHAFRKGHLGRITLDEIPEVTEDYLRRAPKYIKDMHEREMEARSLRRAAKRMEDAQKINRIDGEAMSGEAEQATGINELGIQPPRLWDVQATTLSNSSIPTESHVLRKVVDHLNAEDVPISRRFGPLSTNLQEFDSSFDEDKKRQAAMRAEQKLAEQDARHDILVKEGRANRYNYDMVKDRDMPRPPPGSKITIRAFANPNPMNATSDINIFTGAPKTEGKLAKQAGGNLDRGKTQFWRGFSAKIKVDPTTGRAAQENTQRTAF